MQLNALLTGSLKPLGTDGITSGIDKQAVDHPLYLSRSGFASDRQADLKHHGGTSKAVHHYPMDHYGLWKQEIGSHAIFDRPGAFGENISTYGLTEADVAIGDTFRLGGAIVAVSQTRQPCWKLNIRFDCADMAKRVQKTARTGWYYHVIEEGTVSPQDELVLLDRPQAQWPLTRLWTLLYVDTMNADELSALANLPLLPENIRNLACRRLESRQTESWNKRLFGERTEDNQTI